MKIRIPPINQVHKRTSTLKNVKNRFRFWQSSAKLGAGLRCQNDAKTKFSVTLHALVPVPDFPLPSNKSRDSWTGADYDVLATVPPAQDMSSICNAK